MSLLLRNLPTAIVVSTGVLCASAVAPLRAQDAVTNSAVQQSQNFSQSPTGTSRVDANGMALPQGSTPEEENADADIGEQWVMKHNQKPTFFTVFGDISEYYTSNVALTNTPELADSFFVASFGIAYTRPFAGIWTVNAGVSESLFRYATYNEFDFNSLNVGAGVSVLVHPLWDSVWSFQYGFNHLNHEFDSGFLFSGHSFTIAGTKSIQLSTADSVSFGVAGGYNLADPSSLENFDASVFLSYSVALTRQLSLSANYKGTFYAYTEGSRKDFNNAISAVARFNINRWFSISASVSGVFNESNETPFQYKSLNFGGGLSATVHF
jgi:hypothetical protein